MSDNIPSTYQPINLSDKTQPFLTNLPLEIIIDIFSRLPIPSIVTCKCVCKKFLHLISSAAFSDHNFLKPSSPGMITTTGLLKIFEFVDEEEEELQHHDLHYKQLMEFDPRAVTGTTSPYARTEVVGSSVNGLICLHDLDSELDALYVCNPITREYVSLPKKESVKHPNMVVYGFGMSSNGQYKVVRIFQKWEPSSRSVSDLECQIYTLGTGSWKHVATTSRFELSPYPGNACLNGCLHWMVGDANGNSTISCFDLETEEFKSFSVSPFKSFHPIKGALVVLNDCLCFCDCCSDDEIVVWAMKEYGVTDSWTKEYVISKSIEDLDCLAYEAIVPLKVFKDGDILFWWQDGATLYYSTKNETTSEIDVLGPNVGAEPMLYSPSLFSLVNFVNENVASF